MTRGISEREAQLRAENVANKQVSVCVNAVVNDCSVTMQMNKDFTVSPNRKLVFVAFYSEAPTPSTVLRGGAQQN